MDKTLTCVATVGNLSVVKYYANVLYSDDEGVEGEYPGDIYTSMEDVLKDYPGEEILQGYGVHDHSTGYAPDEAEDWYETVEEALAYINK